MLTRCRCGGANLGLDSVVRLSGWFWDGVCPDLEGGSRTSMLILR